MGSLLAKFAGVEHHTAEGALTERQSQHKNGN